MAASQDSSAQSGTQCTFYYNPFSICSLMVRFTLALKGRAKSQDTALHVEEHLVDIYTDEQLQEWFLCVNPKGQVPAFAAADIPEPLTDSLDITHYIMEHYPLLAPGAHQDDIVRLLKELHEIQYLSLSFKPAQNRAKGITIAVENLLKRNDISVGYRKALEFKADYHERTLVHALEPEPIEKAEAQARNFFRHVQTLGVQQARNTLWIFGDEPTSLDAHVVVFIARLFDAKRDDLIPEDIQEYGRRAMQLKEWEVTTEGRPTLKSLWVAMQKEKGEAA